MRNIPTMCSSRELTIFIIYIITIHLFSLGCPTLHIELNCLDLHSACSATLIESQNSKPGAPPLNYALTFSWAAFIQFYPSVCLSPMPLFSRFTTSLPNLTVRLLIRRSVSQAVLSSCLNIHLLSVYLHLRKKKKKTPRAGLLGPPPTVVSLLSPRPHAFGLPIFFNVFFFFAHSMFNLFVFPFGPTDSQKFSFPSDRWPFENISHPVAHYCTLAASILNCLCPNTQTWSKGWWRWVKDRRKESVGYASANLHMLSSR